MSKWCCSFAALVTSFVTLHCIELLHCLDSVTGKLIQDATDSTIVHLMFEGATVGVTHGLTDGGPTVGVTHGLADDSRVCPTA
jgi:hypothetical protein